MVKRRIMKLTKLEHSGFVLEQNGQKLLCDPVEIEQKLPVLNNVVATIITHKHRDHLQPEVLQKLLDVNSKMRILTTSDAASEVPHAEIVRNGDSLIVGEFNLDFFGKDHREIFAGVVPCENLGVVIDDKIVNPGDSFDLPVTLETPEVLCVPLVAPWCKITDSIDYIKLVKPQKVLPVHNAILSNFGRGIYERMLKAACAEVGAKFCNLNFGESLEV